MVSTVRSRRETGRILRVARGHIEIDHRIELVAGANPVVNRLAIRLRLRVAAFTGCDRCAVDADIVGVGAKNDLLVCSDQVLGGRRLFIVTGGGCAGAKIIDALENDQTPNTALREDIAIQSREGVGAGAIMHQAVAADSFVQYSNASGAPAGV